MGSASEKLKLNETSSWDIKFRINDFSDLISNTEVTNAEGQLIPLHEGIDGVITILKKCRQSQNMLYIIGNGGSAAIAAHAAIDCLNMAKLRVITLHESSTMTCLSNDYGYEHVYSMQLKQLARPDDVLIAISSSGKSKNILNATSAAKLNGATVISLSGFASENPLRSSADLNIWLNSTDYGFVEIGHAFLLHNITDQLKVN